MGPFIEGLPQNMVGQPTEACMQAQAANVLWRALTVGHGVGRMTEGGCGQMRLRHPLGSSTRILFMWEMRVHRW